MENRNSFVVYDNWASLLCDLPDEQAGELIKAICAYKLGKFETLDDPVISAIFNMIKQKLDEDSKKYQEACEKNKENGKKGGAPVGNANAKKQPKTTQNNPAVVLEDENNPKQPKTTQIKPKQHDTDTDNDTDNDTDTEINKKSGDKPHRSSKFVPPTLEEVEDYCLEKNYKVDAHAFISFYESNGWMVGKNKMKDWKAAVKTWELRARGNPKPKPVSAADAFFADIMRGG